MFCLGATLCLPLYAMEMHATPSPARFAEADAAFRERADEKNARKALQLYRKLYRENPKDWEAGWRLAMSCYFVGLKFTNDSELRKEIYSEGRDAGVSSIKGNPKCAGCYFWTAINMALFGQVTGPFKMYFSLGDIKEFLKKSIEIDPTYAYGGAFRLLGQIEEGLPGILGGSNDRAKAYYEQAIKTVPDEPLNYLFLANLLREDFNKPKEALEIVKRALTIKVPQADRLESHEALEALKELAQKLEKQLVK